MPFHLDEFTRFLRYHGLPVGGDLSLSSLGAPMLSVPAQTLAPWLKQLLQIAPADEAAFDRLYRHYLRRYPEQAPPTTAIAPPSTLRRTNPWHDWLSRRRFLLTVQVLMLLGLGYLGLRGVDCYLRTLDLAQAYRCFIGSSHLERTRLHPGPPPADSLALLPADMPEGPSDQTYRLEAGREPSSLARQVPLPPAGPMASDISDLKKSWFDRYRLVFKWLAIVGIFSLLLFIYLHRLLRRRWYLERDRHRKPPLYLDSPGPLPWCDFSEEAGFRQARRTLSRPGQRPAYLLLIEQQGPQDLLARYYDELGQQLAEGGAALVRFFFEQDPRLCWQDLPHQEQYLHELLAQYAAWPLVIVTRAQRLIDPASGQAAAWLRTIPAQRRVWFMSPDLSPADQVQLAALSDQFAFLPATAEGLQALSAAAPGPLEVAPLLPPPDEDDPALLEHLQQYFQALRLPSESAAGEVAACQWRWLCACALYPELSWDLTLALGQRLAEVYQQPVASPRRLLHLLRLPWFTRGKMPTSLRERLRDTLSSQDQRLARAVIVERLEAHQPPADSYARDEHQLRLAAQQMHLPHRWDQQLRLVGQVRAYSLHHEIEDDLLRRELEEMPQRRLSLALPQGLRVALFTQGIPVLGLRPWLRGLLGVGTAFAIFTLFQAYPWANWQRYDQEWYYLADDTTRMRFYHHVGVAELQAGRMLAARNNLEAAEDLRQTLGMDAFLDPAYHLAYLAWQDVPAAQEAFERVSERAEQALTDSTLAQMDRAHLSDVRTRARYNQGILLLQGYQPQRALEAFREAAKQDSGDLIGQARYAEVIALVQNSLEAADPQADQQLLLAADRLSELDRRRPELLDSRLALAKVLDSLQTTPASPPLRQRYAELAAVARGSRPDTLSPETIRSQLPASVIDQLADEVRLVTPFQKGLAVVTSRNRYGFIRQDGTLLGGTLPFSDARPFQEGLAAVQQGGRWGYVDTNLNRVIKPSYTKALDFRDGWAAVRDGRGFWGVIDQQGRVQLPFRYEKPVEFELEATLPAGAEPLAVVYVPRKPVGKYQYLNKQGEIVFPELLFQVAENFDGALARVMRYDVYHYINRRGQCVEAQQPGESCPQEKWGRDLLRVLRNHRAGVTAAHFHPSGDLLITASADSSARVWDRAGSRLLATLEQDAVVRDVAAVKRRVATGNDAGQIRLWRQDGTPLAETSEEDDAIWSLAFQADGRELAVGTDEGEILCLDGQTLALNTLLRTRQGMNVLDLAYDPQGRYLAAGSLDGFLRVWSTEEDALRWQAGLGTGVQALAFRPDGAVIVAGNRQGRITFYESESGQRIGGFQPHRNWLSSLQYSPDGQYLLTASFDRQVKVFRLSDRQEVLNLRLRTTVTVATFSPDGQRLVVATRGPSGGGLDQVLIFDLDRY